MDSIDGPAAFDFRGAFESLPAVAFAVERGRDGAWRVAAANAMQRAALGAAGPVAGRAVEELMPAELARAVAARYEECLRAGTAREYEEHVGPPIDRWFSTALAPFPGSGGDLLLGVTRDITERKRSTQALSALEGRRKELLSVLPDVVVVHAGGTIIFADGALERLLGWQPAELAGRSVFEYLHPDDMARVRGFFGARDRGEPSPDAYPLRARAKDGSYLPMEARILPMTYAGAPARLLVLTDVSERERQRALAERGEARFRELAEMLPEAVYETDAEARFTYVNSAGLALFGYAREDLGGPLRAADMFAPGEAERAMAMRARAVAEGRTARVEYLARRRDGSTFPAMIHTVPVLEGGRVLGTRGVVVDLTERKREEEMRLRADKLHSLGLLAGGIAHDFNNMLTALLGDVSIALLEGGLGPEGRRVLLEAQGAVGRAKGLTRQLLALAAGSPPERRLLDLGRLLREWASFALAGSAVALDVGVGPGLDAVPADEGQLSQAVGNLLINAMQAMGGAGRIAVAARREAVGPGNPLLLEPGTYAVIAVEDSGPGLGPEAMARAFDPYFTTKPGGHGLGLATVYSIARRHGGTATAESPPGAGARFTLYLPLGPAAAPDGAPAATPPAPRAKGRILVLEDEDSIKGYLKSLFRHYGYEYAIFGEGGGAVDAFAEALARGEPFDLALLDMTVPGGMGGKECLERLRRLDPGVRAIMTSGYSCEAALSGCRAAGFEAFLPKPYQPEELDALFQRMLAPGPEPGALDVPPEI